MKAYLIDGQVIEGPCQSLCIGIVAKKIEIEPRDVQAMIDMLERNPEQLGAHLRQLKNRFVTERIGHSNAET